MPGDIHVFYAPAYINLIFTGGKGGSKTGMDVVNDRLKSGSGGGSSSNLLAMISPVALISRGVSSSSTYDDTGYTFAVQQMLVKTSSLIGISPDNNDGANYAGKWTREGILKIQAYPGEGRTAPLPQTGRLDKETTKKMLALSMQVDGYTAQEREVFFESGGGSINVAPQQPAPQPQTSNTALNSISGSVSGEINLAPGSRSQSENNLDASAYAGLSRQQAYNNYLAIGKAARSGAFSTDKLFGPNADANSNLLMRQLLIKADSQTGFYGNPAEIERIFLSGDKVQGKAIINKYQQHWRSAGLGADGNIGPRTMTVLLLDAMSWDQGKLNGLAGNYSQEELQAVIKPFGSTIDGDWNITWSNGASTTRNKSQNAVTRQKQQETPLPAANTDTLVNANVNAGGSVNNAVLTAPRSSADLRGGYSAALKAKLEEVGAYGVGGKKDAEKWGSNDNQALVDYAESKGIRVQPNARGVLELSVEQHAQVVNFLNATPTDNVTTSNTTLANTTNTNKPRVITTAPTTTQNTYGLSEADVERLDKMNAAELLAVVRDQNRQIQAMGRDNQLLQAQLRADPSVTDGLYNNRNDNFQYRNADMRTPRVDRRALERQLSDDAYSAAGKLFANPDLTQKKGGGIPVIGGFGNILGGMVGIRGGSGNRTTAETSMDQPHLAALLSKIYTDGRDTNALAQRLINEFDLSSDKKKRLQLSEFQALVSAQVLAGDRDMMAFLDRTTRSDLANRYDQLQGADRNEFPRRRPSDLETDGFNAGVTNPRVESTNNVNRDAVNETLSDLNQRYGITPTPRGTVPIPTQEAPRTVETRTNDAITNQTVSQRPRVVNNTDMNNSVSMMNVKNVNEVRNDVPRTEDLKLPSDKKAVELKIGDGMGERINAELRAAVQNRQTLLALAGYGSELIYNDGKGKSALDGRYGKKTAEAQREALEDIGTIDNLIPYILGQEITVNGQKKPGLTDAQRLENIKNISRQLGDPKLIAELSNAAAELKKNTAPEKPENKLIRTIEDEVYNKKGMENIQKDLAQLEYLGLNQVGDSGIDAINANRIGMAKFIENYNAGSFNIVGGVKTPPLVQLKTDKGVITDETVAALKVEADKSRQQSERVQNTAVQMNEVTRQSTPTLEEPRVRIEDLAGNIDEVSKQLMNARNDKGIRLDANGSGEFDAKELSNFTGLAIGESEAVIKSMGRGSRIGERDIRAIATNDDGLRDKILERNPEALEKLEDIITKAGAGLKAVKLDGIQNGDSRLTDKEVEAIERQNTPDARLNTNKLKDIRA